jgi:hypothetical protein
MSLLFGRKKHTSAEVIDPDPGSVDQMPARPYRVLHTDLPFYSDPECNLRIDEAHLIVLESEDPMGPDHVQECMPTRKKYRAGQLVQWDLNNKKVWQNCWYKNPETGAAEMAWTQAVEFIGKVITVPQSKSQKDL